jgi:hypothetical protein
MTLAVHDLPFDDFALSSARSALARTVKYGLPGQLHC